MKWNFPITKTIHCQKCGKEFEIILTDRNSKEHPCPDCGTVHIFDFEAFEKKAIEQLKKTIGKMPGT